MASKRSLRRTAWFGLLTVALLLIGIRPHPSQATFCYYGCGSYEFYHYHLFQIAWNQRANPSKANSEYYAMAANAGTADTLRDGWIWKSSAYYATCCDNGANSNLCADFTGRTFDAPWSENYPINCTL